MNGQGQPIMNLDGNYIPKIFEPLFWKQTPVACTMLQRVKLNWNTKMDFGSNAIIRILAISLMLSGCASTPQHLTEENQNKINNIAIISLVPESVSFDKIRILSINNISTQFDMGGKVTDSILSVSRERIAKSHPNWIVKSVDYDRTALLAKVKSAIGFRSTLANEAFAELARKNDLDAIFVVRASANEEDNSRNEFVGDDLHEGLNVLLKYNNFDAAPRLSIRANLSVAIYGKKGEALAVGTIPANLDNPEPLDAEAYDLNENMKHNHRPEVLDKLGGEVIVDLTRRLNLCFDSLGF
jgi:hypothetical protein